MNMNRIVSSLPSLLTPQAVFLAPWSGVAYMAALILIEVTSGGWPSTRLDAIGFLVIFNLAAAVFTPFIIRENDDWKEDVSHGTKPHERYWLGRLMSFHAWATLAVTLFGSAILAAAVSVSIVLAGIVFVSGVLTMTVMLLGRR